MRGPLAALRRAAAALRGRSRRGRDRRAGARVGRAAAAARRAALPRARRARRAGTTRSSSTEVPARLRRDAGRADERGAALLGARARCCCASRSGPERETFDLVELGPSAGLNLVWDRYRYRYEAGEWGREDAVLGFEGEERRPVPGELLELEADGARADRDRPRADRRHDRGRRAAAALVRLGRPGRAAASGSTRRSRRFATIRRELVRGDYVDGAAGACSRASRAMA